MSCFQCTEFWVQVARDSKSLFVLLKNFCFHHICRQEQFEKSAAGRAARAQQQAAAKQAANSNKGEPVLKVLMIENVLLCGDDVMIAILAYCISLTSEGLLSS